MIVNQLIERLMQLDGLAEVRIAHDEAHDGQNYGVVTTVGPEWVQSWGNPSVSEEVIVIDWVWG